VNSYHFGGLINAVELKFTPEISLKNMIGIKIRDNENIDRAINRFKKMITRSRMMVEFKERQQYTKPSEARREAMKKSVRDERRRLREDY